MKKRLIITSLISISLVCLLLIGKTYSVFTTQDIDENANVYQTGNLDITYTTNTQNIKLTNNNPIPNEESIKIKPYRVTITNNGNISYKLNLALTDTSTKEVLDYKYIITQVGKLDPQSLKDCKDNIIKKDIIIPPQTSTDIDIRVWVSDNIPNSEIGKSYYAKLTINGLATYKDATPTDNSDLIANTLKDAKEYIKDLYNDGNTISQINLANNPNFPELYLNQKRQILQDNNQEYRYYGQNPHNYVKYNNELWRIISISKTTTKTNTIQEKIKIINTNYLKENIGYKENNNDYSNSPLQTYLNEEYYNNLSEESRKLVSTTLYNLGGTPTNLYPHEIYQNERNTKVYNCQSNLCGGPRNTSWIGKIGLMYASDYLYATDLSQCIQTADNYNDQNCLENNWLNQEPELTLTPGLTNANELLTINNTITTTTSTPKARPVLYLDPNTAIVSGEGTETNPYLLEILKQ